MTSWATPPFVRSALLLAPAAVAEPTVTTRDIFRAHAPFVMRLVRRLGVRPSDVEDVTQDVFMIVHRRRADLQENAPVRSWLFGIARRVVANYRRHSGRRHELTSLQLESVPVPADQHEQLTTARERAQLELALSRLDPDKREVFVLFELEGIEMREVAQMVGCPLNTAYSRLYAAREIVQQALRRSLLRGPR